MADADAPDRLADGALDAPRTTPMTSSRRPPTTSRVTSRRGAARRRRAIDGRTLAICLLVGLIAALARRRDGHAAVIDDGDADRCRRGGDGHPRPPPRRSPDVALERFDGTPLSIADYRGQPWW